MSITSRSELHDIFFQEVETYLPGIRENLAVLEIDKSDPSAMEELHRFFHNIKGASSQVQLPLLSKGMKKVEALFSDLLEGDAAIRDDDLRLIYVITNELSRYVGGHSSADEKRLYEQIETLFSEREERTAVPDGAAGVGSREQIEWLHSARSILPLLQELGNCLSADSQDEDYNRMVYGKIGRAISILVACSGKTVMSQLLQLMQELQLLMERLASKTIPHDKEFVDLVQEFLRFLEVIFSHPDPEKSPITQRVKKQLQVFHLLLSEKKELPEEVSEPQRDESEIDAGLFDELTDEDESIAFLQELDETELLGDEGKSVSEVEPQPAEDDMDEEQRILLDVFQSECDEHLIVINQSLNSLEGQVEDGQPLTDELRETVNIMRRAVHTLKGAAAMTGVELLARGAHKLEDMLDWLYDEAEDISADDVLVLANGIDVIEMLSQRPQDKESEQLDHLVATLQEYLEARSGKSSDLDVEIGAVEKEEKIDSPEPTGDVDVKPSVVVEAADEDDDIDLPGLTGTLRVRLEDLDELVGIEGELVVARGAIEKVVEEFEETLEELDTVKDNLRRKSQELESGFEVQSLYGFNPASSVVSDEVMEGELSEFDPIELDRYSQLNLIIRSLNEISVDVNSIATTMTSLAGEIRGQVTKQQLTMRLMQDKLMRIRMTPMSSISRILFRIVRETGKKLGKNVTLTVSGEDVYMDRFVWAKITDPLMHVLRNAVDHGIEPPSERATLGKRGGGTIHLEAEQLSRYVVLRVSDDGSGVKLDAVKARLKEEGLVENPETLSEQELLEYLFHPSFTTKEAVSTVSGRGVGLDVVRKNVQELKGTVQLKNNPGQGVTFEFQIPFTLSVNRAVMVMVAGKQFAVPLQDIHHVGHFPLNRFETDDGVRLNYGDDIVSIANLGYYLQLEKKMTAIPEGQDGMLVILFDKNEKVTGVAVDTVVEQREIIVKNLGSHLTHVPGVGGVTLTGTGDLIPILNLRELVESERLDRAEEFVPSSIMALDEPLRVLIVDDSISVRHSVARLVESQSWQQQQAVDGMDALAKLEVFVPDVIVLDIEMPRMNGYEFKSHINNHHTWKDIPIIMLTSRASEKHQQKARELGIDFYMTKPYQDETFIRMLEDIRSL